MTRNEDIVSYWGEMLIKLPPSIVKQWSFAPESGDFLESVGLPFDIRLENDLYPSFQFAPHGTSEKIFHDRRYLIVGSVSDHFLKQNHYSVALWEKNAEVFLVPTADSLRQSIQFLNSDIQSLLLCLQIRLKYSPSMRELGDQEQSYYGDQTSRSSPDAERIGQLNSILNQQRQIAQTVWQEFLRIDAKALDPNLGTFWYEQLAEI